jgi:hypothetical protein
MPSVVRVIETYKSVVLEFAFNWNMCNRRQDKHIKASFVLILLNSTCSLCFLPFFVEQILVLFSFQVPLISCASPRRAGETKNDARPKSKRQANYKTVIYV